MTYTVSVADAWNLSGSQRECPSCSQFDEEQKTLRVAQIYVLTTMRDYLDKMAKRLDPNIPEEKKLLDEWAKIRELGK